MNEKCLMINGMPNLLWFVLCSRAIPFLLTFYDKSLSKTLCFKFEGLLFGGFFFVGILWYIS